MVLGNAHCGPARGQESYENSAHRSARSKPRGPRGAQNLHARSWHYASTMHARSRRQCAMANAVASKTQEIILVYGVSIKCATSYEPHRIRLYEPDPSFASHRTARLLRWSRFLSCTTERVSVYSTVGIRIHIAYSER